MGDLRDTAYLSGAALRARRLRTALAMLGPLIGVLTIIATTTYSASAAAHVDRSLRQAGADLVDVAAAQVPGEEHPRLPAEAATRARAVPGVVGVATLTRADDVTVRTNGLAGVQAAGAVLVHASGPALLKVAGAPLLAGRFLTSVDERTAARVAVVGVRAAAALGLRDGEQQTIGIGAETFVVVGRLGSGGVSTAVDNSVLIPTSAARRYLGVDARPSALLLRVDSGAMKTTVGLLDAAITYGNGYPPRVLVPADLLRAKAEIDDTLRWVILGTGGLALLVGGLGIANVLAMSVLERAPEIGVRRALGHGRGQVAWQFVGEAVLIGLLGSAAGAAVAVATVGFVVRQRGWPLATDPRSLLGGVVLGVLVTALAALHPAVAAARLDPMRVLRPS